MEEKTPLVSPKKFNIFSFRILSSIIVILSILIAIFLWSYSTRYYDHIEKQKFESNVYETLNHIKTKMGTYEQILHSSIGLFKASDEVSDQDWHEFIEELNLKTNYPGVQAVGFSVMLKPQEVHLQENKMRAQGYASFTVYPTDKREKYSSIIYLEPKNARNKRAIGYDTFSNEIRRSAMQRAIDTGTIALSGRVTLKQEIDSDIQAGTIMYQALYKKDAEVKTVEQRRKALIGFVSCAFRMKNLMSELMINSSMVDYEIYDNPQMSESHLLYRSFEGQRHHTKFSNHQKLIINGRPWYLKFYSSQKFDAHTNDKYSFYITVSGLLLYFILLTIIITLIRNKEVLIKKNTLLDLLQNQLRKSELRLQTIIETEPECVKVVNKCGQLLEMNSAGLSMLEAASLQEAQQFTLVHYILPQWREDFIALHKKVMNGERGILEFEIKGLKGTYRWLETHAAPLRNEQGEVIALIGITRDITERKNAEIEVQKNAQFYQTIFSTVHESIFVLEDNFVIDCNDMALVLLNMQKKDIVGNCIENQTRIFECTPYNLDHYLALAITREPSMSRCTLKLADQPTKIIEIIVSSLGTTHENQLILVIRDITQQLEDERLFVSNMRQAQMGEMISIIAHQWRQPLTIVNSISAHIRIKELTKKDSNELLMESMTEIEKQVVYLSQTISDFKDFFRPDRPKDLIQISKVVHNAVNLIDYAIKQKGVVIEEIIVQDFELFIFSNELLQVILTLLKNSMDAFTDNSIVEGKIIITIDKKGEYNTITYQDNAGGIPPDIIGKIFQPYFTTKSDHNGTGLGLSMCKMIVEDHLNGSITALSEDQNTTFTINLSIDEEAL